MEAGPSYCCADTISALDTQRRFRIMNAEVDEEHDVAEAVSSFAEQAFPSRTVVVCSRFSDPRI
jgi:hypothetical protein